MFLSAYSARANQVVPSASGASAGGKSFAAQAVRVRGKASFAWSRARRSRCKAAQREKDGRGRSHIGRALERDAAAVKFDEIAGERQAEPGSVIFAREAVVDLTKSFEGHGNIL